MSLRCRPGDLAIVEHPRYAGRLVEVLYLAPIDPFRLPDGHGHVGCRPNTWVLRFIGSSVRAPIEYGESSRRAVYACGADCYLRPIRPDSSLRSEPREEVAR